MNHKNYNIGLRVTLSAYSNTNSPKYHSVMGDFHHASMQSYSLDMHATA